MNQISTGSSTGNSMTVPEAKGWLAAQPKNEKGKVDILLLIAEGQKRGYCICPKPMREIIDFTAEGNRLREPLICLWCNMPETRESWTFWYASE